MGFTGFDSWLSWYYQAKELAGNLSNEQNKVALIFESLKDSEDKKHLTGLTNFSEMMRYLTTRYNRPYEITSSILSRGTKLPFP